MIGSGYNNYQGKEVTERLPPTTKNICWLAGLIEGEGSITLIGRNKTYPIIQMDTTDRDVAERAAMILGGSLYGPYSRVRSGGWKDSFTARASGRRAISWILTLFVLLGKRRQEQAKRVLAEASW
jgi:hypothetical protein